MRPFGLYAAQNLLTEYSQLRRVSQSSLAISADAFLFRFDSSIAAEFVKKCLSDAFHLIAEQLGVSFFDARVKCLKSFANSFTSYFAEDWDKVDVYVEVNIDRLTALRRKCTAFNNYNREIQRRPTVVEADNVASFDSLLESKIPVIVKFYADYCSVCKQITPKFEAAADCLHGLACFVSINGPENTILKDRYFVEQYPSVKKFINGKEVSECSAPHKLTVKGFISFAVGKALCDTIMRGYDGGDYEIAEPCGNPDEDAHIDSNKELIEELAALGPYADLLRRQGIDELEALITDRRTKVQAEIDRAISCDETSCDILEARKHEIRNGEVPPIAIFLGGGMGAGKSSAVSALSATRFWKRHGSAAIVVEADAFKLHDPIFTALRSVTPGKASQVVHGSSLEAAEELLLKAVSERRDVVFDGTMSWFPYVKQTLAMIRDNDYFYRRGPGYEACKSGDTKECYWQRRERRSARAASYRIEMVAVTIEPQSAVGRGIVRRILTGRGVPITAQLSSHKMFSMHFMKYCKLFDATYLFDMSSTKDEDVNSSMTTDDLRSKDLRRMIAIKPGVLFQGKTSYFQVLDEAAFCSFLRRSDLNVDAHTSAALFSERLQGAQTEFASDV